jgi:GTP-dependent phosphoenolpyruvate carboxykinase
MKEIKLHNRYNANIWLEYIGKNLWSLKSKKKEDLDYMRFIYNDDNSIYAIDPSGGPFLSIDGILTYDNKKLKIVSISRQLIFELVEE